MKRTLSLFLSTILVLSMVMSSFTLSVYAEVTGGAFKNNAGEIVKEFTEDFDGWNASYWKSQTAAANYVSGAIDANSDQAFTVASRANNADGNAKKIMPAAVITEDGNKYLELKDIQSDGYYKGRFYFNLGGSGIQAPADGEKLYLSVKLKADDTNFRKLLGTSDHLNTEMKSDMKRIVEFAPDGNILLFDQNVDTKYTNGQWYKIDVIFDNGSADCYIDGNLVGTYNKNIADYFSTTYKMIGFAIIHLSNTDKVLYTPDTADATFSVDDLNILYYGDSDIVDFVPSLTSIGADNKVSYDATTIDVTLNGEFADLKPEHIEFVPENTVSDIAVTSDGEGNYTYTLTLGEELVPWTSYTLKIDKEALGGARLTLDENGLPSAIGSIEGKFDVAPAPFSLKAPEFELAGDTLTVSTVFVNNTSDAKYPCFMLVGRDNNGAVTGISKASHRDLITNENGEAIALELNDFTEGSAQFFVTDGYTNELLFDVCYGYNYDETEYVPEAPAASVDANTDEIVFCRFNYNHHKMEVCLNVGSDGSETSGVIYVYKRGTSLNDNLVYASYVTTAADGTLYKEIAFPEDLSGEFTVAFCGKGKVLSTDFPIYDSDAAFGENIVKASFDAAGKKYDEYSSKITEDLIEGSLGVGYTSTNFDENAMNFKFTRSDKEDSYRIVVKPGVGKQTKGVHKVKYKLYADKAKADGTIDWKGGKGTISVNRVSSDNIDGSYDISSLLANRWYDVEITFDIDNTKKSYITVTDLTTGEVVIENSLPIRGTNGFTNMWMYTTYTTDTDVSNLLLFKDFQVIADFGDQKPAIRYIAGGDVVDYGQREVSFKISEAEGLTANDVFVKNSQGKVINAVSMVVTKDMGEYIITAKFEQDFASWQTYTLCVNPVGLENYRELVDGNYVTVKPSTREFTTPVAPLDIADPEIETTQTSVSFNAEISNNSGKKVNAVTILAVAGSDGVVKSVTADSKAVAKNNTEEFENENSIADGDVAKYFVINGFDNPSQLFNKTWSVDYNGNVPEAVAAVATEKAADGQIAFDEFEYNTKFDQAGKKIVAHVNTGKNTVVEGVLYVYSGSSMSESKLPVFVDYVTTAANGTFAKEIKFASDIANSTNEYTIAFYSNAMDNVVENTFNVYSEKDYADYKKANITENAKKASTFSGLRQLITGTNAEGETVTDAWDIFKADANTAKYDKLTKKEAVYIAMIGKMASVKDFDDLVELFEKTASDCYSKENDNKSSGGGGSSASSSNRNYGSSSTVISESVANPTVDSSSTTTASSVFADLSNHWAQKHAEALYEMGVVNGYADGSFKADNAITRAELTKIIVEALDVPTAEGKAFTDVANGSWYAAYVESASAAGVVTGFEDGTFGPDKNVSRQDAALMIYRAVNLTKTLPTGYKFFADEADIADYASDAIRCLGDLGIITGSGKNAFKPLENITRGEMAALICRAIDYIESHLV